MMDPYWVSFPLFIYLWVTFQQVLGVSLRDVPSEWWDFYLFCPLIDSKALSDARYIGRLTE